MCVSHLKKEKEKLLCVAVPDDPCPDAVVPLQVPVEGDAVLSEEVRNDEIWVTCLLAFDVIH